MTTDTTEAIKRKPWLPFAIKALVITATFAFFFMWLESRFVIGIDGQAIRCLPDHKYYVVDKTKKETKVGRIIAYRSIGLSPFFEDGTMMAKIIQGMPGDRVLIDERGVFVNGTLVAEGFALLDRIGRDIESLYKDEIIPENKYLLLAPAPESYDGRYWGYIDEDQIVGKATPFL